MILTHDQFGMIPQSPEMQKEILEGELQNLEDNLAAPEAHGNEISRGILKRRTDTQTEPCSQTENTGARY